MPSQGGAARDMRRGGSAGEREGEGVVRAQEQKSRSSGTAALSVVICVRVIWGCNEGSIRHLSTWQGGHWMRSRH